MSKYRFENGAVYEYSSEHKAYLFVGKLNGMSKRQFIEEYENVSLYS